VLEFLDGHKINDLRWAVPHLGASASWAPLRGKKLFSGESARNDSLPSQPESSSCLDGFRCELRRRQLPPVGSGWCAQMLDLFFSLGG